MRVAPGATASVEAAATSANLGPGFDVLALALSLRLRVKVEALSEGPTTLDVRGEGAGRLKADGSNRFLAGLEQGLRDLGVEPPGGWKIAMDNEIPIARGLGSSAAATVAGLMSAQALAGFLPADRVLALAAELEGHPDNAAAALHGGFVVVGRDPASEAWRVARFEPPSDLRAVVFVPTAELSTERMRDALPESVQRRDAVHNVAGASLVVAAMAGGDLSLLAAMSHDRLHEPYRAQIYPAFEELKRAAVAAGAFGAALSGAGSSVIALCRSPVTVAHAMNRAAERMGVDGSALVVAPRAAGALIHAASRSDGA